MMIRSYKLEKENSEAKLCGISKVRNCLGVCILNTETENGACWTLKLCFRYTENLLPSRFKSRKLCRSS